MAVRLKEVNQDVDLLVLVDIPPDLKTGYKAKDIRRITRIVLSFQGNLPWLYDYLALIRVREPLALQQSKSNDQTKGIIKQMLSLLGHRSENRVATNNTQPMTRGEQLRVTLRIGDVVMANSKALYQYKTPSYDGKIILLKTNEVQLDQDKTWGWRELVKGVDVHTVPGDHVNLLRHPHASAIAEILRRYLDCIPNTTSG
jgi:thioesterase domain-containing protein